MKLSELRRLTIKKQLRIHFTLPNGMECIVNEHGLAKVPALKTIPDFNLEDGLSQVTSFRVVVTSLDPAKVKIQNATAEEVRKLIASVAPGAAQAGADHDD